MVAMLERRLESKLVVQLVELMVVQMGKHLVEMMAQQ
jgi:hypothetical protein